MEGNQIKNFRRKAKILEGNQNINFGRKTKIVEGNQKFWKETKKTFWKETKNIGRKPNILKEKKKFKNEILQLWAIVRYFNSIIGEIKKLNLMFVQNLYEKICVAYFNKLSEKWGK